jgi:hypothetical protein
MLAIVKIESRLESRISSLRASANVFVDPIELTALLDAGAELEALGGDDASALRDAVVVDTVS